MAGRASRCVCTPPFTLDADVQGSSLAIVAVLASFVDALRVGHGIPLQRQLAAAAAGELVELESRLAGAAPLLQEGLLLLLGKLVLDVNGHVQRVLLGLRAGDARGDPRDVGERVDARADVGDAPEDAGDVGDVGDARGTCRTRTDAGRTCGTRGRTRGTVLDARDAGDGRPRRTHILGCHAAYSGCQSSCPARGPSAPFR